MRNRAPQFGRLRRRPLDRAGNVVQLEVEKNLLTRGRQLRNKLEAAAIGELHADLIEGRGLSYPLDKPSRLPDIGRIEGDDQSITRCKRPQLTAPHLPSR